MKPEFEHGGYYGSAEVSVADNMVHGRLLFIRDVVTYAASTPQELELAFQEAVDDYLETCKELGDEPNIPFKGTFNVRFSPEMHRDCVFAAIADDVSLNDWVKSACRQKLDRQPVEIHHHHHETKVIMRHEETVPLTPGWGADNGQESVWQSH